MKDLYVDINVNILKENDYFYTIRIGNAHLHISTTRLLMKQKSREMLPIVLDVKAPLSIQNNVVYIKEFPSKE